MANEDLKAKIASLKKSKRDLEEKRKLQDELWNLEHPFLSRLTGGIKQGGKKWGKHLDEATKWA